MRHVTFSSECCLLEEPGQCSLIHDQDGNVKWARSQCDPPLPTSRPDPTGVIFIRSESSVGEVVTTGIPLQYLSFYSTRKTSGKIKWYTLKYIKSDVKLGINYKTFLCYHCLALPPAPCTLFWYCQSWTTQSLPHPGRIQSSFLMISLHQIQRRSHWFCQ